MAELKKVIRGLEKCTASMSFCNENCPYYQESTDCRTKLERDALSLLKAQEPRVMTKEEIIDWDGYIWLESRGMKAMKAVLIDHGMCREPYESDFQTKDLAWENYQKTWRAWTAMPTNEQRKAVKWDD